MLIRQRKSWQIAESEATPESVWLNRRTLMGAGLGAIAAGAMPRPATAQATDPTAALYPAKRNEAFTIDRPLTDEALATSYNNFYEFGTSKDVVASAKRLVPRPWDDQDRRAGREARSRSPPTTSSAR